MAVFMTDSWTHEWADIVREVIFKDPILKELMMIPTGTSIIQFEDEYFIKMTFADVTVIDEDVRIVYANLNSNDIKHPNVIRQEMSFDVFVKKEHIHDVGDDRLMERGDLICVRLRQLLSGRVETSKGPTAFKFTWIGGPTQLGSSTIGYRRYNISFEYNRT